MSKTLQQVVEILTTENGSKQPRVKYPTHKIIISFLVVYGLWIFDTSVIMIQNK